MSSKLAIVTNELLRNKFKSWLIYALQHGLERWNSQPDSL